MKASTFKTLLMVPLLLSPLFADDANDISRIESSVNNINRKVDKLEKSIDEINKERENQNHIYYTDINQVRISTINPEQYNGPYTIGNNFAVISYVSMSNGVSERAAFVTLKNNGPKTRILKEYIIATFADNSRRIATGISTDENVKNGEYISVTAYFGKKDYPVVHVGTR